MNIKDTPYAPWLEELIAMLLEIEPEKIGLCAITPSGDALTSYYGDLFHTDKALMGYHINLDATMDVIRVNAREIVEAAEEVEDEE